MRQSDRTMTLERHCPSRTPPPLGCQRRRQTPGRLASATRRAPITAAPYASITSWCNRLIAIAIRFPPFRKRILRQNRIPIASPWRHKMPLCVCYWRDTRCHSRPFPADLCSTAPHGCATDTSLENRPPDALKRGRMAVQGACLVDLRIRIVQRPRGRPRPVQ